MADTADSKPEEQQQPTSLTEGPSSTTQKEASLEQPEVQCPPDDSTQQKEHNADGENSAGKDAPTVGGEPEEAEASADGKAEETKKKRKVGTFVKAELPDEVKEICKQLKEENFHLIKLIYEDVGLKSLQAVMAEVLAIEQGDGMLTADKKRKRTPGGIFLHLMKEKIGKEKFNLLVKMNQKERKKQKVAQELNS